MGLAAKSWDGLGAVANLAAAQSLVQLGAVTPTGVKALDAVVHPPVMGGGQPVGRLEPRFRLELA
jgi:hypothetical protein